MSCHDNIAIAFENWKSVDMKWMIFTVVKNYKLLASGS